MRLFVSAAAVVALTPVVLAQVAGPKINTLASATQCQPVQFTWQGGSPPYYLAIIPGGQPGAPAIKQFGSLNANSLSWMVDLPTGTAFTSTLRDSSGAEAFSDIQTVQSGPDSSCLNASSGTTAMAENSPTNTTTETSAASTETATTSSVAAGVQKVISTTGSSSASATASGAVAHAASVVSSTTAATATSSNAASLHNSAGAIGIAGLLGLVGAALLG